MDSSCISIKKLTKQWTFMYLSFNRGLNIFEKSSLKSIFYILVNLNLLCCLQIFTLKPIIIFFLLEVSFYFSIFYFEIFLTKWLSYKADLAKMVFFYSLNVLISNTTFVLGKEKALAFNFAVHFGCFIALLLNKKQIKLNNLIEKVEYCI